MNVRNETSTEAEQLITFLRDIPADNWQVLTECEGWNVGHVVAHLIGLSEQTIRKMLIGAAATRMDFNAMVQRGVDDRYGSASALIERLAVASSRPSTPRPMRRIALAEYVCHSEDIYRALGHQATHEPHVVADVARLYVGMGGPIRGKTRAAGLRLEATDCDFAYGSGPVVSGHGIDLALGLIGRTSAYDLLEGDGVSTFRTRA